AMILHKVEAALRSLHPFRTLAVYVTQIGERPRTAPLHPDALVGRVYISVTIQTCVNSSVFTVDTISEPEIRTHAKLILYPSPDILQLGSVHLVHTVRLSVTV